MAIVQQPTRTILRVKRKANEDPLESLVVSKRATQEREGDVEFVFSCIGTVPLAVDLDSAPSRLMILDRIREHPRTAQRLARSQSAREAKHQRKESLAEEQTAGRLRRAMTMRGLVEAEGSDPAHEFLSVFDFAADEEEEIGKRKKEKKDGLSRQDRRDDLRRAAAAAADLSETITCNSLPMQRLSLRDHSGPAAAAAEAEPKERTSFVGAGSAEGEQAGDVSGEEEEEEEYVYDLYYAEGTTTWEESRIAVRRYLLDPADGESDEEAMSDDDDSNAEGNWRHDYPDEEENFSSESEEASWDGMDSAGSGAGSEPAWSDGGLDD
eukprot:m.142097 g.142097  ORF g.142097 m.142097 type:complete len:324 (-) comp14966_c1_seq4:141-1112(-)